MTGVCSHPFVRLWGLGLALCLGVTTAASAQQTNKRPRRVYDYAKRVTFTEQPAYVPAPVIPKKDTEETKDPDRKMADRPMTGVTGTPALRPPPPRRVNLRKDQDSEKTPWILQPDPENETNGLSVKATGWGWLVDSIEANRRFSEPILPDPETADAFSQIPPANKEGKTPDRTQSGLAWTYTPFQPVLSSELTSAGATRAIENHGLVEGPGKNLPERPAPRDTPPMLPADFNRPREWREDWIQINDTLRLARSRTDDAAGEVPAYVRTRALLSAIVKPYAANTALLAPPVRRTDDLKPRAGAWERNPADAANTAAVWRIAGASGPADAVEPGAGRRDTLESSRTLLTPPRSTVLPAPATGSAPRGFAPAGFTPTTPYASPLDVLHSSSTSK